MNHAAFGINTNVSYLCGVATQMPSSRFAGPPCGRPTPSARHAEISLNALLGLCHFWITLHVLVFGRTGGGNQRGVQDRPALHIRAFLDQLSMHVAEHGYRQFVPFQPMKKARYGAFVRHHVFEGIQPSKLLMEQGNVIQRFFHRRIRVTKPLFHEVNELRCPQMHWWSAVRGKTAKSALPSETTERTFPSSPDTIDASISFVQCAV